MLKGGWHFPLKQKISKKSEEEHQAHYPSLPDNEVEHPYNCKVALS